MLREIASHGSIDMGRPEHADSSLLSYGEHPSPFGPSPPLSAASSPSPLLLPANAKRSSAGRRRHAIVRLICSPFAAVFKPACARAASASADDNQAMRRPSLEDLLRMEASSNLDPKQPNEPDMDDKFDGSTSWNESAIVVFDFVEDDDTNRNEGEEDETEVPPLAISKDEHAAIHGNEHQTAIVPAEEFGLGGPVAGFGAGAAMMSPTVLMNVERLVLVLAARSRALKGSYGRLAGRQASGAADKAEFFYDRPIPLGRRCRVKHLEETPYF